MACCRVRRLIIQQDNNSDEEAMPGRSPVDLNYPAIGSSHAETQSDLKNISCLRN